MEMDAQQAPEKEPRHRSLARNLLSEIGAVIAIIAVANIIFLVFVDLTAARENPYLGVLAYMVVPAFLFLGILLFVAGVLLERRRRKRTGGVPEFPDIDLNIPRIRYITYISVAAGLLFFFVSILGSYRAYHYTDSDEFCGTLCHQVMHPEYTAYKASPHARVGCVGCHVGSGAGWYVRSKLSGAYQVYSTALNKYPRPIQSPVHNLRPARETCEQCHWPAKFFGGQLKVFTRYAYDEPNTKHETRMLIKVGGGSPASGMVSGIHWHMYTQNEITYIASDRQRQKIEWIRTRNRQTGVATEYWAKDSKLNPQAVATAAKRVMDCVDCHNRPTHIYVPPDRAVDAAMVAGRIDPSLPYVKQQTVEALTKDYKTTPEAVQAIDKSLRDYYSSKYASVYGSKRASIERAVSTAQSIFQTIRFPEMNVDWRTHPDNIGHFYFSGCFRCHDNQHVSSDGRVISNDCHICHEVLSSTEAAATFEHPVDIGDLREVRCGECHTGASM
jgi:hypothetical protein